MTRRRLRWPRAAAWSHELPLIERRDAASAVADVVDDIETIALYLYLYIAARPPQFLVHESNSEQDIRRAQCLQLSASAVGTLQSAHCVLYVPCCSVHKCGMRVFET